MGQTPHVGSAGRSQNRLAEYGKGKVRARHKAAQVEIVEGGVRDADAARREDRVERRRDAEAQAPDNLEAGPAATDRN